MRIISGGSLGDEVALTGALREYRAEFPSERLVVQARFPDVFAHLSWLDGTHDNGRVVNLRLGSTAMERHLVEDYVAQLGGSVVGDVTPIIGLQHDEHERGRALLGQQTRVVAIDTWAGWPSRRWPISHWQAVAHQLRESVPDVWIVEVGASTADCTGATRPSTRLDAAHQSLVDQLTVRETAAVLASTWCYAGSDSGLAHIAAAVGAPSVVLFGSVSWWTRAYPSTHALRPSAVPNPCGCSEVCGQVALHGICMALGITPSRVARTIARVVTA